MTDSADTVPSRGAAGPEVTGATALAPLLDGAGEVTEPLMVVDLDASLTERTRAGLMELARTRERVLVGVRRTGPLPRSLTALVAALDLTLVGPDIPLHTRRTVVRSRTPESEATTLAETASARPRATMVLASLLRASERLDVPDALITESLAYSTLLGGAEFRSWLSRRPPRPAAAQEAQDVVAVERLGQALHITLNRPARHNAYDRAMRDALVDALLVAEADSGIERILLDGAGPSFCSGGDLDEFGTAPDPVTAHFVRTHAGAGRLLHRLGRRIEVEARLHGRCIGAGIELPAFAGRVTAHADTVFRLPELAMGLIPGAGGTVSISRRIGRWRTLYMALSGRSVDTYTALEWGLIDHESTQPAGR